MSCFKDGKGSTTKKRLIEEGQGCMGRKSHRVGLLGARSGKEILRSFDSAKGGCLSFCSGGNSFHRLIIKVSPL